MSLHRSLAIAALAATVLVAGCSDDPAADPTPVTAGPTTTTGQTTTSLTESTTTTADATASTEPTSPTSPPVTKPLTTAPPSELLTEVTAAYDAAYAAFLSAELTMDEANPDLLDWVGGRQLESVRELFRRSRAQGIHGQANAAAPPWSRVERLDASSASEVALEVCRYDNLDAVDSTGAVVDSADRPFRYIESMQLIDGRWKWVGREWVDKSRQASDCALPS